MRTGLKKVLSSLAILVGFCPMLFAQQDAGSITGTVFDSGGAVLPRATLSLKSGDHGQVVVTPLQVGNYEVTVSADGFQTEVRGNLELQIQQTLNLDLRLKIGASSERVVVDSTSPALQTEESSIGQVIDTKQVANLPLNGRNVYQLVTLSPGVAVDPSGRAAISGQASQNQYYSLDGVDNNNYSGTLASG